MTNPVRTPCPPAHAPTPSHAHYIQDQRRVPQRACRGGMGGGIDAACVRRPMRACMPPARPRPNGSAWGPSQSHLAEPPTACMLSIKAQLEDAAWVHSSFSGGLELSAVAFLLQWRALHAALLSVRLHRHAASSLAPGQRNLCAAAVLTSCTIRVPQPVACCRRIRRRRRPFSTCAPAMCGRRPTRRWCPGCRKPQQQSSRRRWRRPEAHSPPGAAPPCPNASA